MNDGTIVSGSLFEDDYLVRTLGPLGYSPDIALTELVANAWDAGTENVSIIIPEEIDEELTIEDDGIGLTPEQFHKRWMKLGYNRLKHQGEKVEFPIGKSGQRLAFGRNGVGRHGLLCFNDEYTCLHTICGKGFLIYYLNTLRTGSVYFKIRGNKRWFWAWNIAYCKSKSSSAKPRKDNKYNFCKVPS